MNEEKKYVFALEPNEEYSERCGEVFLTNIGYLVFHCTLCDMRYKGFKKFANHVRDEHLLSSNFSDSFLESELAEFGTDNEYNYNYSDIGNDEQEDMMKAEETVGEHAYFEIVDESDTSRTMKMYNGANDTQFIEDSESGIKTNDDISSNMHEQNEVPLKEIDYCPSESDEGSNIADIRPIRNTSRSKILPGERNHKCSICGAAFKEKHNLNHHLLRHSNARNFPCSQCKKKFFTAAERRVHLRTHTQERPFLCSECGLRFITNVLLVNHMKRHNNQRDHHCPHCEKSFFEKSRLTVHLYAHSKQKPYVCKICGSNYMHSRSLKNHMELHKNINT